MDFYSELNKRFFLLMESEERSNKLRNPLISDFEFGSLDDALKELPPVKTMEEATPEEMKQDLHREPIDPRQLRDTDKQDKTPLAAKTSRLIHSSTVKGIQSEDGKEWDLDKLRNLLSTKPKEMLNQNDKMKHSGGGNSVFYNLSIPAYHGIYYNEADKQFELVRTCPSAGACKAFCYAAKGGYVQYPHSSIKTGQILNFLLNHSDEFKNNLVSEIKSKQKTLSKKGKKLVVRWHDTGDFFNGAYRKLAFEIAKETPDVKHYAYTKQVNEFRNLDDKPDNFTLNFSQGGTQDKSIEKSDKQATVILKNMFKDLDLSNPKDIETLKDRVAEKEDLDRDSIISYDELMKKPEEDTPKYNVLVWAGHGDDAAVRKDVINTMLLIH